MSTATLARPATESGPVTTYRPPRLDDLLHVTVGYGDETSTVIQSVADDGRTLTLSGPTPHGDLRVVIRRVDRHLTRLETTP